MDVSRVQKFIFVFNCLLITSFTYTSTRFFYSVISNDYRLQGIRDDVNRHHGIDGDSDRVESRRPISAYRGVPRRNLFNVSGDMKDTDVSENIDKLDMTDLSLKLHGTAVAKNGNSYAIIEDTQKKKKKHPAQLVREGGSISEAILTKVFRDKVVLSVNGLNQVLLMEEYQSRSGRTTRYSGRSRSVTPARQTRTIRQKDIDKALGDMKLMKQVRIRPHFRNGESDGFIVSGIRGNSLLRKMGLRNGDIIEEVNGRSITSVDEAMAFYKDLNSGGSISVQLKRRGRERTIDYTIK